MGLDRTIGGADRSALHRRMMAGGLAVGVTVAGAVVGGLFGVGAFLALMVFGPGVETSALVGVVTLTIAAEAGYAVVGLAYLLRVADGVPLSRPSGGGLLAAVAGSIALVAVGQGVLRLVPGAGIDDVSSALGRAGLDPVVFLALAVVSVVLVGPAEELLFRGAVQGTLRRVLGPWAAIGSASVLFTIVHITALGASSPAVGLAALTVIFLVSLAFGYAFERTGSLVLPIVMHSLYDGLLLAVGYLVATDVIILG